MMTTGYLLEYSKVFDESPKEFSSYLDGLGIDKIVDICSNFLSLRQNHPEVINYQNLLFNWFSQDNIQFRDYVLFKIGQLDPVLKKNLQIINLYCIYQLFEYSVQELPPNTSISVTELQVPIFKTILVLNEEFDKREDLVLKSIENVDKSIEGFSQWVTGFLCSFDLTNYNIRELVFTQFVKSYLLFKFLEEFNDGTRNILRGFLINQGLTDWKDYLRKYLELTRGLISPDREGYLNVTLDDQTDESTINFLNNLIVDKTIIIDDLDFIRLRNKPLYKIDDKTFRVISPLFTCEKMYQGVYFQLKEINEQLKNNVEPHISGNFRSFYCSNFTEEYLLYKIMEQSFPKKFVKFSGKELRDSGSSGEPDYYIRNGTKVFLFESKDVLLNKDIKQSNDYNRIEKGLKEKFYSYEKKGEQKLVGVFQLLENIRRILCGENKFDNVNPQTVRIYPILMVYHNVFNTPGVNGLVNHWFKSELKKLPQQGLNTDNVNDLVIIDINIFILYNELFKSKTFRLEELLDNYIQIIQKTEPPLSSKPLRERYFDSFIPFSLYVENIVNKKGYGKSMGLFKEFGMELIVN